MGVNSAFSTVMAGAMLVSSASWSGIISEDAVAAIKNCVAEKIAQHPKFRWRTHTYYIADSGNAAFFSVTFDACGNKTAQIGDAEIRETAPPPTEGDILEGRVVKQHNSSKLRNCERFEFVPPVSFYNDGIETHDVDGSISRDKKRLQCILSSAGSSSGGGHVYGVCYAHVTPVYDDNDKAYFLQVCARQLL